MPILSIVGLLAAAALVTTAGKGLRDRRGRRWVTEHVVTKAAAREALLPVQAPEQTVRARNVRLRPHRASSWSPREEVQDANPGDHPADDRPGTALR